jgi:hypothetical protein
VVGQPSQGAVLQDWRSSSASLVSIAADGQLNLPTALITAAGALRTVNITDTGSTGALFYMNASNIQIQTRTATNRGLLLTGATNQSADLLQYQAQSGSVLGGRNAVGQIYTGSTAGLTTAVGGATTAATSAAGTATITTTTTHNILAGDLVVVAGITPTGFNGTYVVTTVPSATAISYVNATAGPQTVAGTVSIYAQTSIVARSAATTGAVVRGATLQASNLQEWQNNSGSILAAVRSDGKFKISTNNIATTVGATGTASALPALPVGYFQIEIGGVVYKTPYYNN